MPILFASSFRREIRQLSKAQKCKKQRGKLVCRIYTLDAPLLPSLYFSRFVIGSVWPQGERRRGRRGGGERRAWKEFLFSSRGNYEYVHERIDLDPLWFPSKECKMGEGRKNTLFLFLFRLNAVTDLEGALKGERKGSRSHAGKRRKIRRELWIK